MEVQLVERIYRAIADRDLQSLLELLHPECVITQDARLPWGGRFTGHAGFGELSTRLLDKIDSAVTVEAVFEADGAIYQCGRTRGYVRSSGVAFDIAEVHRWVIHNGQAVEAHFAVDTPAMLDALSADGA